MDDDDFDLGRCWHIAIVSISESECQCMDCLRIWPKEPGFRSDWPAFDLSPVSASEAKEGGQ
jgi:hypothetical protein